MSEFDDALEVVIIELLPKAEAIAEATERSKTAVIMTLLRPHVAALVDPKVKAAVMDNRTRKWNVRLTFAAVAGELVELISRSDDEVAQGFDEVISMLLEYAEQTHENSGVDIRELPSLSTTNLKKRLGGMRPAISKSGGKSSTIIRYAVNEHHYLCNLEISREDIPLDKPVEFGQ